MKILSPRQMLFYVLGHASRQRGSVLLEELKQTPRESTPTPDTAGLLDELRKDTGDIDAQKCLDLIKRGVDFTYPNWKPDSTERELDRELAKQSARDNASNKIIPSDPQVLVLAASKGLTKVVEALLDHTYIHPAQRCPASGLSALMAAAKYGHTDTFKLLDNTALNHNSPHPELAGFPASALFDDVQNPVPRSARAQQAVFNHVDLERWRANECALENCHEGIIRHSRLSEFTNMCIMTDYRKSDTGYDVAEREHDKRTEEIISEAKAAKAARDEAKAAPPPAAPDLKGQK